MNSHEELNSRTALSALTEPESLTADGPVPMLDPSRRPALSSPELRRRVNLAQNPDLLLTAILDECHFLMREVAVESALRAETVQDRLAFVHTALDCARAGAEVGKGISAMQALPMSVDRANAIVLEIAKLDRESDSGKQ